MSSRLLAAGLAAVLTACTVAGVPADGRAVPGPVVPVPDDARAATVERVVDGDTVVVDLAGVRERVRLLRIDAPEVGRDGRDDDCLAVAASEALSRLLPEGAEVRLQRDVEERDQYDRLLAHLWVDGTWVNGAMLRLGYADLVTFPPNVALDDEVRAARTAAREDEAGLWAPGACPDGNVD